MIRSELDVLLDKVRDESLRAELRTQIDRLKERRSFGLVFERHIPERVRLLQHPIRVGSQVVMRDDDDSSTFEVTAIDDGVATLVRTRDADGAYMERGEHDVAGTETSPLDALVVITDFGEPVLPGLRLLETIERGGDKPFHIVINGENHHALEMLRFTHAGKVDCIYIDPPYNSGARDWKYNNDYVDANDSYRHSKWLAFMERRLKLARELMNPSESVLIATIDEKEYLRLGLLLEQMFPDANIQMVSSVISPSGAARNREFTRVNEFLFFVMIGAAAPIKTADDMLFTERRSVEANRSPIWNQLRRLGAGPARSDSPSKFYPILVDPIDGAIVGSDVPLTSDMDRSDYVAPIGREAVWPIRADASDGRWELNRRSFEERLSLGQVRTAGRDRTGRWSIQYLRNAQIERLGSGELLAIGKSPQGWLEIDYAPDRARELYAKTIWNKPHMTRALMDHGCFAN